MLRKQFWITFMIKFAASRSVMFGLNLCLGRDGRRHLWESVSSRDVLLWSSVIPDPLQQLLGHMGSSRSHGYSRNPVCSGDPRIHTFLGRAPADGQLFPKWYLLQKFDCLATETGQACVQHECNQGDDCIHIGAVETEGGGQPV